MKRPEPEIGQIVRFDYLWRDEARRGRIEGGKDRPCAVILAMTRDSDGATLVYLAPITHSPPQPGHSAVEIPHQARELTGLDDARAWLVTSEVNMKASPLSRRLQVKKARSQSRSSFSYELSARNSLIGPR